MVRKLHDELRSLTSGIAATGLEYVKHRKKKQLRGGIIPLLSMGLQAAVGELATWAMSEDARLRREKEEQDLAKYQEQREYVAAMTGLQRNWTDEYKTELKSQLDQQKREEQAYLKQQALERDAYDAEVAEEQRRAYQDDIKRQRLSAYQQQLATKQQESGRLREQNLARTRQSQQQINDLERVSNQRFTTELQQRLRSAAAQQQAQAKTQEQAQKQKKRIVAPKSTEQKVRTRR